MDNITLLNPFIVGRYVSGHYFCDRENETALLVKHAMNGRNTALISPRRLGKTGLIQHTFNQNIIKDSFYTFFIDIYATSTLAELVYLLGKAIFDGLKPKKTVWKEQFFQIIKSFHVGFKLDPQTAEPGFDLNIGDIHSPETTLDEIFSYLDKADKPCLIAIDEFQQIGEYQEKNVEALLRTKIQQSMNAYFIFSGSKRHTMYNMFNSAAKPFYQSSISMSLEPIPMQTYVSFAKNLFQERGKDIEDSVIEQVYRLFEGCTWFVQMIMNELFALTDYAECCKADKLSTAWTNVIMMQSGSYMDILSKLAPKQKMLLQAIAKAGRVTGITSADFVKKYSLPSASSVQAALKALVNNDIVTQEDDTYRIYDYFFAEWTRRMF